MEKALFVASAAADAPPLDHGDVLRRNHELSELLDAEQYPEVALQVEDHGANARWRPRHRDIAPRVVAMLSVWSERIDDLRELEPVVTRCFRDCSGSLVAETIPRWQTDRRASMSEPRPGVTVTSLLRRAPTMTRDEFIAHWVDVHQPMSLRIHPQWTYVRNIVVDDLTREPSHFDAICEEGFASVDDVLDPARFYGADLTSTTWQQNRRVIGDDVPIFLDTARTTSSIMKEYCLRVSGD